MKRLGLSFLYLISIHLISLFVFFLFRLYLFCDIDYTFSNELSVATKSVAFIKGVWFDNVIACYVMLLPLVIIWSSNFLRKIPRFIFNLCAAISGVLFYTCFIISASNVPYFNYFFNNINSSIFNWFGYGATTGGLIFGETTYYLPIAICLIVLIAFWWSIAKLTRFFYNKTYSLQPLKYNIKSITAIAISGCMMIGLCLFGIRGRTGYNPIKVSQAYYCQDPFLNQLGINPTFNLLTSTLDDRRKENRPIDLIADRQAITNVQSMLNRAGICEISPIAREITVDTTATKKNIVLILMESMSAHLMSHYGNTKQLTPFLDSLVTVSKHYINFYSSGLHTNHGLYATLYSYPTIMFRNAMKGTAIPVYSGLPTVLSENGYHNMFFMTHESQYDNMNAFLRTNGFHEIHAEENYPKEKIVNSFGVQDDYLFSYAIDRLNRQAETNQPFFSVLLTISNHPPYIIPKHFTPQNKKQEDAIVEFADHSIRSFMHEAKKQPWYSNTIFVLLGDHGKIVNTPECEVPQACNHVPLIIFEDGIKPQVITDFAMQIDISPTLLDILGISYTQNNFGINLNKEKRPYAFYTTDKHIAARDSSRLYIYEPSTQSQICYDTTKQRPTEVSCDSVFEAMRDYCFSMLQSAQYMAKNKMTTDTPCPTIE